MSTYAAIGAEYLDVDFNPRSRRTSEGRRNRSSDGAATRLSLAGNVTDGAMTYADWSAKQQELLGDDSTLQICEVVCRKLAKEMADSKDVKRAIGIVQTIFNTLAASDAKKRKDTAGILAKAKRDGGQLSGEADDGADGVRESEAPFASMSLRNTGNAAADESDRIVDQLFRHPRSLGAK